MYSKILAVVFSSVLFGFVTQAHAVCDQIAPNPNPVGNTITNTSADGCNELVPFDSFGTLNNNGTLNNIGTLNNHGFWDNNSGVVNNSGTLNNYGGLNTNFGVLNNTTGSILNNYGRLLNDSFAAANQYSGTLNNYGSIRSTHVGFTNNGTLDNYGLLDVEATGNDAILNNHVGALLKLSGTLENNGTLNNSGTLNNNGTLARNGRGITNSGEFLNSGSVTGSSGNYFQTGGRTVINGTMTQAAVKINGGVLSGSGSITAQVTIDGGTIAAGNSPGAMSIFGDYTQTMLGSFAAEIGGLAQGITYDFLNVSGTATLDGLLDVSLYDFGTGLFSPKLGDTFDILSAESIIGSFSNFSFAALAPDLVWNVSYLSDAYATTDVVRLQVAAVPEPEIYAMMAVGMGVMGWVARRRKKKQAIVEA